MLSGGGFGLGWVRDFLYMSTYVAECNRDPEYVAALVRLCLPNPLYSLETVTLMAVIFMNWFFQQKVRMQGSVVVTYGRSLGQTLFASYTFWVVSTFFGTFIGTHDTLPFLF